MQKSFRDVRIVCAAGRKIYTVGENSGEVGANGGKGAEKGRKSAENVEEVGGVRQKVGKFADGRAKTPRRREGFL